MAGYLALPPQTGGLLANAPPAPAQAAPAQSPVLMQAKPPNQQLLQYYTKNYGSILGDALTDPKKLMQIIDTVTVRNAQRSPGSQPDMFVAQRAQAALADIYGINGYQANGEYGKFRDPRANPDTEAAP